MHPFRKLILAAIASGAFAGLLLFAVQHFTVVPLIHAAEVYEAEGQDHGWHPAEGWQRISLTAAATVLSSIGFAAILFGCVAFAGRTLTTRLGVLWGLAAFACLDIAPALGLPPQPPGTAVAEVSERQLWWVGTVVATAVGLWMLAAARRMWLLGIAGGALLALPHLIGAPTPTGESAVPAELSRQFAIASLTTKGIFWLVLGAFAGGVTRALPICP